VLGSCFVRVDLETFKSEGNRRSLKLLPIRARQAEATHPSGPLRTTQALPFYITLISLSFPISSRNHFLQSLLLFINCLLLPNSSYSYFLHTKAMAPKKRGRAAAKVVDTKPDVQPRAKRTRAATKAEATNVKDDDVKDNDIKNGDVKTEIVKTDDLNNDDVKMEEDGANQTPSNDISHSESQSSQTVITNLFNRVVIPT
jgi:hypothetical protein